MTNNYFLRFNCFSFVAGVQIKNNIIIYTAPILKKFQGQNINNLIKWFKKKFPKGLIEEIK